MTTNDPRYWPTAEDSALTDAISRDIHDHADEYAGVAREFDTGYFSLAHLKETRAEYCEQSRRVRQREQLNPDTGEIDYVSEYCHLQPDSTVEPWGTDWASIARDRPDWVVQFRLRAAQEWQLEHWRKSLSRRSMPIAEARRVVVLTVALFDPEAHNTLEPLCEFLALPWDAPRFTGRSVANFLLCRCGDARDWMDLARRALEVVIEVRAKRPVDRSALREDRSETESRVRNGSNHSTKPRGDLSSRLVKWCESG